jgi:hypothetical protein
MAMDFTWEIKQKLTGLLNFWSGILRCSAAICSSLCYNHLLINRGLQEQVFVENQRVDVGVLSGYA